MNSQERLLNNLNVAIIVLDNEQHIDWLNLAAESLLGCSLRLAQGQKLGHIVLLPNTLAEQINEALIFGQSVVNRKIELPTRLSGPVFIDCVVTPLLDSNNKPQILLELLNVDRQTKIATERALLEQQQQSHSILRGVAHEVLNPLGSIRGAAQLLEQELPDPKLHEYTQVVINETDRLQNLLHRMLGPGRRQALKPHNIHEILNYVSRLLLTDNPGKVVSSHDYDPSIPDVICDREQLIQVFINLVSNALYALKDTQTPNITVKTRVERNFTIRGELKKLVCKINIMDNGCGIPTELKDTLFFPLISGRAEGTGLGLSISQSIIAQHGGLIECNNHNGLTVFEVTLPIEPLTPTPSPPEALLPEPLQPEPLSTERGT